MAAQGPLAYIRGQFVPQTDASLPLHDAGLVWGATVTDLCRTVRHRLYCWEDHLARFGKSCQAAGVIPRHGAKEISRLAEHLVEKNARLLGPNDDLALVLLVTAGTIGYYAGQAGGIGDADPTFAMHTFPLPVARYRRLVNEGAHLVIPTTRQVPAVCIDPRIKQRSRMHWWLAEQQARRADPVAQALLLDTEGHITEAAGANFLLVRDGTVLSPTRSTVLEGVSLGIVAGLCRRLGIPFVERPLGIGDCQGADEAMLTSTPYCLAGVSRLNGMSLPFPGPVMRQLLAAWSADIGLDIHGQILGD
jgi:branched-subunit amino acid aminotransferase/4-amino-4-deoxychorismate lyase